jgi:hypothetical protein
LITLSGGSFSAAFEALLGSFGYEDLDGAHHRAHLTATDFCEIAEYETALTSARDYYSQLRSKLLTLKPTLLELSQLFLDPKAEKKQREVSASLSEALSKLLKMEQAQLIEAASNALSSALADAKASCQRIKGKNAKAEAAERCCASIEAISQDLAISKTQMRDVLETYFRPPRFDTGQRRDERGPNPRT